MKSFKIVVVAFCILSCCAGFVHAGDFGERFRKFVLGSEAEAYAVRSEALNKNAEVAMCLGCHDGTVASHISVKSADAPYEMSGFRTGNHPVGMSYDTYAGRKPREYRPQHLLDQDVRLVDGKVTCLSCHRLRARVLEGTARTDLSVVTAAACMASGELTAGPRRDDLCRACHVK